MEILYLVKEPSKRSPFLAVIYKLLVEAYMFCTRKIIFPSLEMLYSTLPVELQNVEIAAKDLKAP